MSWHHRAFQHSDHNTPLELSKSAFPGKPRGETTTNIATRQSRSLSSSGAQGWSAGRASRALCQPRRWAQLLPAQGRIRARSSSALLLLHSLPSACQVAVSAFPGLYHITQTTEVVRQRKIKPSALPALLEHAPRKC